MRNPILTLLVGSSVALSMVVAAPAASAATSWSDTRVDATVSDLPFYTTVDLSGMSATDDPTDCAEAMVTSVWTKIQVPAGSPLFIYAPTFWWNWNPVVAIYAEGGDTAQLCLTGETSGTHTITLAAGTYDVLVGSQHPDMTAVDLSLELLTVPANDDWASPVALDLPATGWYDLRASSLQSGEAVTPCSPGTARTQWYEFTAPDYGWIDVWDGAGMGTTFGLFTAPAAGEAPEYAGQCASSGGGTLVATPGVNYLLQISGEGPIDGSFVLRESSPPEVHVQANPYDPSTFDTMDLIVYSNSGSTHCSFDFGDGSPSVATEDCAMGWRVQHRYAKDGTYRVTGGVIAPDGRTGSSTLDVLVATHDATVASLTAPKTASVGKAKQVSLNVASLTKYTEFAGVTLYASTPEGGWTQIGSTSVTLPGSKKSVPLTFTWIPAATDIGANVVLKAVVLVSSADPWGWPPRDARPENDQRLSAPIRVSR